MHSIAIILAGGVGSRLDAGMPKQFLEVDEKPIIAATIENFEKSPLVDAVLVVCLEGWIPHMRSLAELYGLTKVKWIIPGGETGHDSVSNAIFFLKELIQDDDFIIVHDAARPLLPQAVIEDMMRVAKEKGNASASLPCLETLVVTSDQQSGADEVDRSTIRRVQTPQAYRFGDVYDLYVKAKEEGRHDFVYINTLAIHYGMRIFFSKGFGNNIKITTKEDIALYKALLQLSEEDLLK